MTIKPTDCLTTKDKINYLQVYVYEEARNGTDNMYLRHDIIILEVPLCRAWVDCPLKGEGKG